VLKKQLKYLQKNNADFVAIDWQRFIIKTDRLFVKIGQQSNNLYVKETTYGKKD